jgi:hypothetical protein
MLGSCARFSAVACRPDPEEERQFKLTKAPLLLLVEQRADATADPEIRHHLVRKLREELDKKDLNKQIVPEDDVRRLQRTRPMAAQWTEAQLGKALNAQQVLHVQLEPYLVARDTFDPTALSQLSASVRVIDVASGEQLWPLEVACREVVFKVEGGDPETGYELKNKLAAGLADRIAKLFYTHLITDTERARREAGMDNLP